MTRLPGGPETPPARVGSGRPAAIPLLLLLLLTALLYAPGLGSGLFADDIHNLRPLEHIAADGYAAFIFSGASGPTGRPLSLLTFALQHRDWPGAIHHFKFVNLLIHLACGLLIYAVAGRLAGHAFPALNPRTLALLAAGLWLLHPMHLTTVLYTVQRMTQLSTLFMLLGLFVWLLGREAGARGSSRNAYLIMSAAIVVGTGLAVFSKENGALLPLLILVTDLTLLRALPRPGGHAVWQGLFLVLPALLIAGWLLWTLPGAIRSFEYQPYTMTQKLLTEASVLVEYLRNLLLPRPGAFGFYQDHFPVAEGILQPPRTLVSVLIVCGLIGGALASAKVLPAVSFGLLWFFAGHLLESTHLNLAIYFEHRNYLPSIGILFLLAWATLRLAAAVPRPRLIIGAALAFGLLCAAVNAQNVLIWRDPLRSAVESVRNRPDSPTALMALGNRLLAAGQTGDALALLRDMEQRFPRAAYPRFKQAAILACVLEQPLDRHWWQDTVAALPHSVPFRYEMLSEIDRVIAAQGHGECAALDYGMLRTYITALAGAPHFSRQKGAFHELAAILAAQNGDVERSLRQMGRAVRASPTISRRLEWIDLLLAVNENERAERALEALERDLARRPLVRAGHDKRLRALREMAERQRMHGKTGG
jgi:tetratricopeptide (TPR) repeat protein